MGHDFVDSAAAALQALDQEEYDAIVTDMRMPVMDGAQLLEQVKLRHPNVIRVVLSGQSSQYRRLENTERVRALRDRFAIRHSRCDGKTRVAPKKADRDTTSLPTALPVN
jgi:CheY-like chemotaxis protein